MLCLTVKVGERVHIADSEIIIEVVELKRLCVRLAFSAERSISIHREIIQKRIDHANGRETKRVQPAANNKAFFTPVPPAKKRKSS